MDGQKVGKGRMKASIEWSVGVIRVHPSEGGYGDTYTWSALVHRVGDTAWLGGVQRAPTKEEREAVRRALHEAGIREARWLRRVEEGWREVTFLVPKISKFL